MASIPGSDVSSYIDSNGVIQSATPTVPLRPKALGHQQLLSASLSGATALTAPEGATVAVIQNNGTQAVRWRDDGTNPTTSTGQRLAADDQIVYDGPLSAFKVIREADGAILDVAYYS